MIYILNSSVLVGYGHYRYSGIDTSEVRAMLKENNFISAVGHESTANLLTFLLGIDIPVNRAQIKMEPGDKAVIFRLKSRLAEGQVITSIEEMEAIGYEFSLLEYLET